MAWVREDVPVRGRPAPITLSVAPGLGLEGCWPMLGAVWEVEVSELIVSVFVDVPQAQQDIFKEQHGSVG
jgi:hypothetical protein